MTALVHGYAYAGAAKELFEQMAPCMLDSPMIQFAHQMSVTDMRLSMQYSLIPVAIRTGIRLYLSLNSIFTSPICHTDILHRTDPVNLLSYPQ